RATRSSARSIATNEAGPRSRSGLFFPFGAGSAPVIRLRSLAGADDVRDVTELHGHVVDDVVYRQHADQRARTVDDRRSPDADAAHFAQRVLDAVVFVYRAQLGCQRV